MKPLLWFIAGVIAGLVGQFFYELWGKPALPKVERCDVTYHYAMPDDELAEVIDAIREQMDDTQPVKVGEPDEWQPEPWHEDYVA
jgi:hypothetical protein